MSETQKNSVILLGAGGHAKVLLDLCQVSKLKILGVCDPKLIASKVKKWRDINVLGDDDYLSSIDPQSVKVINGIGLSNFQRKELYLKVKKLGFMFQTVIHPSAQVSISAQIKEGVQIFAGSIIQADVQISDNTIINTGASVDHDCFLGEHVHLAPRSTLCGHVTVGNSCFVGSGAILLPGSVILDNRNIHAGSLVRG